MLNIILTPGNYDDRDPALALVQTLDGGVTLDDLNAACVFDVATTGDESFAKTYLIAQDLRLRRTVVTSPKRSRTVALM